MKWLYRIFRLFKCSHKYVLVQSIPVEVRNQDNKLMRNYQQLVLKRYRCGDYKIIATGS